MYNQNNGMYSGYEVETSSTSASKESFTETESSKMMMGSGYSMPSSCCMNYGMNSVSYPAMSGVSCPPIYECPQERVIHREFVHEVPHIMPINTRIVNHHIYKHSYSPCYTCCEENCVSNVTDCCSCCNNF